MRKKLLVLILLGLLPSAPALALDPIARYVPDMKPVGSGRLSVFMMDVYDATLFAPQGILEKDRPLALQLKYLRAIKGQNIADRSVMEIRNLGMRDEVKLATWHTQMRRIFPDVNEGVVLTGVLTETGESVFFESNQEIGRIKDPDFGTAFFGIWLNEKTSAPYLRKKLLGTS